MSALDNFMIAVAPATLKQSISNQRRFADLSCRWLCDELIFCFTGNILKISHSLTNQSSVLAVFNAPVTFVDSQACQCMAHPCLGGVMTVMALVRLRIQTDILISMRDQTLGLTQELPGLKEAMHHHLLTLVSAFLFLIKSHYSISSKYLCFFFYTQQLFHR